MSPNLRGALLMMASMAGFSINDAFLKMIGDAIPLFQLLFLRGMLAAFLVYVLARMVGQMTWRAKRQDWLLIGLRSFAELGAAICFLTALFNMPLANATAILQMLPLTVTMGVALVFRETVGWRRWAAIAVGFIGMLLIVQPGGQGFNSYSLYALGAVGFVTIRDLSTRRMTSDVPSLLVTFVAAIGVALTAGLASAVQGWSPVSLEHGGYIVLSAFCILGGYLFSVMTMRVGDFGFIAPFRYTSLLWALLLGWWIFGDWPESIVLTGAAIVTATGLYTLYRETLLRRKKRADAV